MRLKTEEVLKLLHILVDKDEKEVLDFLKECFIKKVEEAPKPSCTFKTAQALKMNLKLD